MASKYRGYMLTEILVQLGLISILLVLSVQPIRFFLRDLHQIQQDYQTQCTARNLLNLLRRDIEQSQRMVVVESDVRTGGPLLYLQQDRDIVLYQLGDGFAYRMSEPESSGLDQEWKLPRFRIDWKPWEDSDGRPQAIEIITWIERTSSGNPRSVLRNAEVMFVNPDPQGEPL